MSRPVAHTSAKERQNLRQHYYATSEQEAGLAHLWHMQRLAAIRLSPSHTIQDAPDVDFQQPGDPTMDHYRHLYADRYAQQVRHDEAQIYAQNVKILHQLLLASDDTARKGRNMNLVPTSAQVCLFDNIENQTSHRLLHRQLRQRQIAQENERLLLHLISVSPNLRTAKELGTWYTTVHKKRLERLSRFKPAEQFAGERVLKAASRKRLTHGCGGSAAAAPYPMAPELATIPPLLRGHPYPPLSIAEASRTAPASLLPAVRTTSYGGVPLVLEDSIGSLDGADDCSGDATAAGYAAALYQSPKRVRGTSRPDWQPISATDIPLLHYAADLQLRREGGGGTSTRARGSGGAFSASQNRRGMHDSVHGTHRESNASGPQYHTAASPTVLRVTPSEEGGVTQMWRHALQRRHERIAAAQTDTNPYAAQPARPFRPALQPRDAASADGGWKADGGCFVQSCLPAQGPGGAPPLPAPQTAPAARPGRRFAPAVPSEPCGSGYRRRRFGSPGSASPAPVPIKWNGSISTARITTSSQGDGSTAAGTAEALLRRWESSRITYAPV
ncbi:conserved hypothetical protein [Leishmania mexicana MHOM/GT/2001/U1103]|uniref:Uncharacterized protein n=1 Tax=Leishmania mexicana (strain MHOM/GT/2001/U1103) TaxID=929439 RepID=E9AWC0_LEIMU|nr:conserved hypothetical protein [Leishmania mexicana MHOM/GT/2001/U1103]CBZ27255.1 conserved hypothetical protein [Leishmania mexicana MHOM/GT/2001/U1103]